MALEYGAKYITSKSYYDAKELFFLRTRVHSGVLPKLGYYSLTNLNADQVRDILSTQFYSVTCSPNDLTNTITGPSGSILLKDIVIQYQLPVVMNENAGNFLIVYRDDYNPPEYVHPCYSHQGTHIGGGCQSFTQDSKYRFYNGSTPILGVPYHTTVLRWYIPLFVENADIMRKASEYYWSRNEPYFMKAYANSIKTILTPSHEHLLKGILIEWEHFYIPLDNWNTQVQFKNTGPIAYNQLYLNDNRYNNLELSGFEYGIRGYAKFIEELAQAYVDQAQQQSNFTLDPEYTCIYDQWYFTCFINYINTTCSILKYYGRTRGGISIYCYRYDFLLDNTLCYHSQIIARSAIYGIHVFDGWLCSIVDLANNYDNPTVPTATIAQAICIAKFAMAMGCCKIWKFGAIQHDFFSFAAAYDEMQPYHEFIKYGTNYVVPPAFAKLKNDTVFFGKQFNNTPIPEKCYICCRQYNNKNMFLGFTTDGLEYDIQIRSPSGNVVNVSCGPFGRVTIE